MHSGAFTAFPPYLLPKSLFVSVCWFLSDAWRYLATLISPCISLSPLLCFCADEMKDDFDNLGPDATLQAVGNGTGELTLL